VIVVGWVPFSPALHRPDHRMLQHVHVFCPKRPFCRNLVDIVVFCRTSVPLDSLRTNVSGFDNRSPARSRAFCRDLSNFIEPCR
jgi:hypothetical protein